jgi:uncharacterized lipoprotein YddW (UPF0748 family)
MFNFHHWQLLPTFLLSLSLIPLATLPARAQSSFSDVQGHWAQSCIETLQTRRIINGYQDGTFRPNAPVTRAEFATMLDVAFPNAVEGRDAVIFTDVSNSYWATPAIRSAYQRGFLSGYPGNRFNPTENILRVQAWVSLVSGLNYAPQGDPRQLLSEMFDDAGQIPSYARNAIAAATEKRLIVNYPNLRRLDSDRTATRADVSAFLCQALMGRTSPLSSDYVAFAPIPIPNSEIRGVWLTNIDSDVLFSKRNLEQGMKRLADLNFNTVYPTVWNWGYTLYPSQVAQRVTGKSMQLVTPLDRNHDPNLGEGRDMLKEAIAAGKTHGLRVIPWFEFGFMAPADSELARRHPHWLTERSDGTEVKMEGEHPRVWLNPFHPEVQQFILDLLLEIVTNYEVDGIQLDDHLGLPSEYGYDDYTVSLYKQEHNGNAPPLDPKDPDWLRWRADKITAFKERMFREIKARNPKAIVSLSPNPQEFSYQYYLADWETWERRGLVEEIVLQLYRNDINVFIEELDRPEVQAARRNIPVGIGILSGLRGRPIPMSQIQEQVEVVREKGFAGVSFFFYESMWSWSDETPTQRERGFGELFPNQADRPSVIDNENWQSNP